MIDRGITTASVTAIGLASDDASATHVRLIVVGVSTAAAGVAAVIFPYQLPSATDVRITVIDCAVAAAVRGISVNTRTTAAGIRAVSLVADHTVATHSRGPVVDDSTAVRPQGRCSL